MATVFYLNWKLAAIGPWFLSTCLLQLVNILAVDMALSPSEIQYQLAHINESQGPLCIGVISMFLVIDFAAVSTRLYSKRLTRNKLGWDDYFILAALVRLMLQCQCRMAS